MTIDQHKEVQFAGNLYCAVEILNLCIKTPAHPSSLCPGFLVHFLVGASLKFWQIPLRSFLRFSIRQPAHDTPD